MLGDLEGAGRILYLWCPPLACILHHRHHDQSSGRGRGSGSGSGRGRGKRVSEDWLID